MKFQTEHKTHPGFQAIKWLIENAKTTVDSIQDKEFGEIERTVKSFSGKLPYNMAQNLLKLAELGYKHPNSRELIINIDWLTNENTEHYVSATFGSLVSNQTRVEFYYKKFKPLNA